MKTIITTIVVLTLGIFTHAQTGLEIGYAHQSFGDLPEESAAYAAFGIDLGPGELILEPQVAIYYGGKENIHFGLGAKAGMNFGKEFALYAKATQVSEDDDIGNRIKTLSQQKSIKSIEELQGFMYGVGITLGGKKSLGFFVEYLRNSTQNFITGGLRINFRAKRSEKE